MRLLNLFCNALHLPLFLYLLKKSFKLKLNNFQMFLFIQRELYVFVVIGIAQKAEIGIHQ